MANTTKDKRLQGGKGMMFRVRLELAMKARFFILNRDVGEHGGVATGGHAGRSRDEHDVSWKMGKRR